MLNASTANAAILGFLFCAPARDAVRGFCATFATKSGKEMGDISRPHKSKVDANRLPFGSRGKTMKSWVLKKIPTNKECMNRVFRVPKAFIVSP